MTRWDFAPPSRWSPTENGQEGRSPQAAYSRSCPAAVFLCCVFCSVLGPSAIERRQWHRPAGWEGCQVPSICQSTPLQRTGVPERSHPCHPRVSHQVGSKPFLIAAFIWNDLCPLTACCQITTHVETSALWSLPSGPANTFKWDAVADGSPHSWSRNWHFCWPSVHGLPLFSNLCWLVPVTSVPKQFWGSSNLGAIDVNARVRSHSRVGVGSTGCGASKASGVLLPESSSSGVLRIAQAERSLRFSDLFPGFDYVLSSAKMVLSLLGMEKIGCLINFLLLWN